MLNHIDVMLDRMKYGHLSTRLAEPEVLDLDAPPREEWKPARLAWVVVIIFALCMLLPEGTRAWLNEKTGQHQPVVEYQPRFVPLEKGTGKMVCGTVKLTGTPYSYRECVQTHVDGRIRFASQAY